MEKIQPTRQKIIDDVRLWSKNFLEVSNVHLGGVPACPFARKAWADDKVWVAVKTKHSTYKKELNECIKNLDFTKKDIEQIAVDTDRDFWMTAQEALEYGIVDEVLTQRELADKK